jgi:Tfp pilus assembly protein PilX
MRKRNRVKQGRLGGFALVITLITIVLLTIMAVAFLTSSSLDQATARAFVNRTNAELAARTAVNSAIARLTDNFSTYNDSATSWEKVNQTGGALQYQGTTLYYRDQSPDATAGVPATMRALPLISGAKAVAIPTAPQTLSARQANLRLALPTDGNTVLDDTNSYDLNHARIATDTQGTIGTPVGAASRSEFRAQWINETDADGKATSRYAYWMEDESFKANVNLMGITPRGAATAGDNPSQIVMQGLLKALGVSGFDAAATAVFNSRSLFPGGVFFEYPALDQAAPSRIADTSKFESTIFSGASNLSRTGTKRINLNNVVVTSTVTTAIRQQLDEIISAIKFQSPNFGQRFYRIATDKNSLQVLAPDQTIYLNKIAANIRDYIDTDSQPTVVNNDSPNYTVRLGTAPTHCFVASGGGTAGADEVVAIGKEQVPAIQEYALRVRETAFSAKTGTSANYTISIDHYFEVWNASNKDISLASLGPNPFLLIANQPGWDAGSLTSIPAGPTRDLKLFLSAATKASDHTTPLTSFPAGTVTVIMTDPTTLVALTPDLTRVYYIPIAPTTLRTYTGSTNLKNSNNYLRLNMIDRTTTSSDYEMEVALGNDLGMLESAWGGGAITSQVSVNVDDGTAPSGIGTQKLDDTKYHFRGASLKGNIGAASPNSTTGDPRTNAEQMRFDLNGGTANNDKTRYFGSSLNDNNIPGTSSLGGANSTFVNPNLWPDYSSSTQAANDAPAVIANAALTSIGQLGDIFDPVRSPGDATGNDTDGVPLKIRLSRSGGRTLKIGQSDRYDATTNLLSLWDGTSNSTSREWASWRLTDMFTTSDSVQLDGRININGVGRDSGAALKAALYQYVFQDSQLGGTSLSDAAVQLLIDQLTARIVNDGTTAYHGNTYPQFGNTSGPIAERGELSEMPVFNTGSDLTGTAMSSTYDRGREELYRRLTALTTTRGNIFTVYAVGQSLIPPPTGSAAPPTVTSTSQIKVTVRVDPVWDSGTPSDPFVPAVTPPDPRFKKPDRYAIKILYAGD